MLRQTSRRIQKRQADAVLLRQAAKTHKTMKIRIKLQHDKTWKPDLRAKARYWVNLPNGRYFPIFSGHCGQWFQMYAPHMGYPSPEAAITDACQYIFANDYGAASYRRIRAKERVFAVNLKSKDTGKWIKNRPRI